MAAHLCFFSYYGLTVWFPDMIRHLQAVDYAARTKVFPGERVEHVTFNFTLENQIHRGGQYFNDKCVTSLFPPRPTPHPSYPLVSFVLLEVQNEVFGGQIPVVFFLHVPREWVLEEGLRRRTGSVSSS